ncbi:unnamed protein product [Bubo scandiacus]
MSMLSVGGILLILTNMQVGNLFGKYRSIIITLYNGAFDSSSAIFLIIKVLYEHGLSLRAMFLFLAACSAWHLLRTLFLMPRTRIPYPLPPRLRLRAALPGPVPVVPDLRGEAAAGGGRARGDPRWSRGSPEAAGTPPWCPSGPACARGSSPGTWPGALPHAAAPLPLHRHPQPPSCTTWPAGTLAWLCGVLCAPWNGLILDRHKRGKTPRPEGPLGALADLRGLRAVAGGDGDAVRAVLGVRGPCRCCPSSSSPSRCRCSADPSSTGATLPSWPSRSPRSTSGSCTGWPWRCRRWWPCCSTPASPWCGGRSTGTHST